MINEKLLLIEWLEMIIKLITGYYYEVSMSEMSVGFLFKNSWQHKYFDILIVRIFFQESLLFINYSIPCALQWEVLLQ
jgi:hypothetical protein